MRWPPRPRAHTNGPSPVSCSLAAAPPGLPWHRVINSRGEISLRRQGGGEIRQRRLLRAEGIRFDRRGRLDLPTYHWPGPGWAWLQRHGYAPETT